MSWDFITIKTVRGRKAYRCEQCHTEIAVGERHVYVAGKCEGDMNCYREHSECREACLAHDKHVDRYSDEYAFLADDDDRDDAWLITNHPAAAARLGLVLAAPDAGGAAG